MSFDNLRLHKEFYSSSKGFTAELAVLDPDEQYIGTPLEGLDAFERQLKRFDIHTTGPNVDNILKFFSTKDSAVLFPEYVKRTVEEGIDSVDLIKNIIAITTNVSGMNYSSVEAFFWNDDGYIEAQIKNKSELMRVQRHSVRLNTLYEIIKYLNIDLFGLSLKQMGKFLAKKQFCDGIAELCSNNDKKIESISDIKDEISPFDFTSLIANSAESVKTVKQKLNDNGHDTEEIDFYINRSLAESEFILFDKNATLEKVCYGKVIVDYDKLINKQFENAAITTITGFSKLFPEACKKLVLE